ncbi:hypothetical protein [Serratia marcescens]|uniref:hypothetical protein n=1 Tax=Serratia marcescens TaxID=615 RepID=UPI0013DCB81E|nr:hypothetical protein [Serratia marcescens]
MLHYSKCNVFPKMAGWPVIFLVISSCSLNAETYNTENPVINYNNSAKGSIYSIDNGGVFEQETPDGKVILQKSINSSFSPSFLSKSVSQYASGHYSLGDSDIYNFIKVPESNPDYWAMCISILALISSIAVPFLINKKQRKDAINEGFWLREVIFPKINTLMFDFCNELKASFNLSLTQFVQKYSSDLSLRLGELRDTFNMFHCFPNLQERIDSLDAICDELENDIDNHQSESIEIRISDVSKFNTKMLAKMLDIHRQV